MGNKKQLTVCLLSFALLLGMVPSNEVSAAKKVSLSTAKLTVTKGKSKTLKVKNIKKTVKWKILSGKTCITLKKKGKAAVIIKGKKKGTAKVQATIGKIKLTCKVTVKNTTNNNTSKSDTTTTPPTGTQTPSTGNPTNEPTGSKEQDISALKNLIAEQRERGAMVNEDLNSDEYGWNEDGRLIGIDWESYDAYEDEDEYTEAVKKNLKGDISFSVFTALEYLYCGSNQLTSLDVSGCVNLTSLNCANNQLTSLDVSGCVNLTSLTCENNQLTSLDVSGCVKLIYLDCNNNQLTGLDVSDCVNLTSLYCENNQLTSLDVSNCVNLNLKRFHCDDTVIVTGYNK